MAPLDADSQFKFLISCIKHSTAGKIDFISVANELGIVSKAAAAKRYERLMKSHGVAPGGGNRGTTSAVDNPKGALPNSRKRKAPATEDMDDPEDIKPSTDAGAKKAAGPKKEVKGEVKQEAKAEFKLEPQSSVKEEAKVKKERAHVKKDEAVTVPDNDNDSKI